MSRSSRIDLRSRRIHGSPYLPLDRFLIVETPADCLAVRDGEVRFAVGRRVLRVETLTDNGGADGGARLKAVTHLTTPPSPSRSTRVIYVQAFRNNTKVRFLEV